MVRDNKKIVRALKIDTPVLNLELISDLENGTRIHIISGSGSYDGSRLIETSDVAVLQQWIAEINNARIIGFSVRPPQTSDGISRILLAHSSSVIVFKLLDPVLPLPVDLVNLFGDLAIGFFCYDLVRQDVRNSFTVQFGVELGPNFVFLNINDQQLNWNLDEFVKLTTLVSEKRRGVSSMSSQWNSIYLHSKILQVGVSELHLALEAGKKLVLGGGY